MCVYVYIHIYPIISKYHVCVYLLPDRFLQVNSLGTKCKKMLKVVNENCQIAFQNVDLISIPSSSV